MRLLGTLLLIPNLLAPQQGQPACLESGRLGEALYSLALPERWNGRLLIEAPGLRPPEAPRFAEIQPDTRLNRALLDRGWMLATTSYRRNGLILADAIDHLRALRTHVATTHGEPTRTIVVGSSMGGLLATLLAERGEPGFDGAVALGAALEVRDPAAPSLAPGGPPRIPLLFVSNTSEADGPRAYTSRHAGSRPAPVLRTVNRPGHVNLNAEEKLEAILSVDQWLEDGEPPASGDATRAAPLGPSTARVENHTISGSVTEVDRIYGNLTLDVQPADLERIGARYRSSLLLDTPRGSFEMLWADSYADVAPGEWVAFTTADGTLLVARNLAHAADTAGLNVSSEVRIRLKP